MLVTVSIVALSVGTRAFTEMRSTAVHVEQLIKDPETGLVWVIVDAVEARQEAVALAVEVADDGPDVSRLGDQHRALAVEARVKDRPVIDLLAKLLGDQLKPGCVRHLRCPRA